MISLFIVDLDFVTLQLFFANSHTHTHNETKGMFDQVDIDDPSQFITDSEQEAEPQDPNTHVAMAEWKSKSSIWLELAGSRSHISQ